ncbi:TetR/AcrR family transcriptional regulator [Helicobacter turcicus]|uniref:TetR/AcrR family transcriptional regulator n=1 Tax=Helicobacter turcicus TaxID=2867412 RepID=A0ABS7JNH4_9HELI|nr:TetR/AcrR family transcriptional regulator [Helicobacter turcicus]MBX7490956.1 TetR/AcrR family transcriptional regulator [Helicobacter turcicus]MBX7545810.1 TetR/AcrR family transcriptional regulator [Helicobacter turcicus]
MGIKDSQKSLKGMKNMHTKNTADIQKILKNSKKTNPSKKAHTQQNKIKNKKKQEKILKTAWKLFLQYGYKKTSLQMIIKETGGSLATIYKIFHDKKTLFSEAIRENGQEFIDSLDKDFSEIMTPYSNLEEYFYRIGVRVIRQITSKENIAFMRLIVVEGYDDPELIEIFHHIAVDRTCHFFLKALEDYNTTHNLGIEDISESSRVFISLIAQPYLIDAIMIPNYTCPDEEEIQRIVRRATKIFMLYLKHYKEIK